VPGEFTRSNIWEWLVCDARTKPVFEFLLPPGKGTIDKAVNFFCEFYNRRAIPGRKAVPFTALSELGAQDAKTSTQQRLDILAGEEQSNCDLIVFAARIETALLGVILYPQTATATIYNWTAQRQVAETMCEVGYL